MIFIDLIPDPLTNAKFCEFWGSLFIHLRKCGVGLFSRHYRQAYSPHFKEGQRPTDYVFGWIWVPKKRCLGKPPRTNQENDWSSCKRQLKRVSGLVEKCKRGCYRDLSQDCSSYSPYKFWAAIKKHYPTKLPFEQGSAFVTNGSKLTDKSFIGAYFSTIARNLKSKPILDLPRDFVWSKPAEGTNHVTERQFTVWSCKERFRNS